MSDNQRQAADYVWPVCEGCGRRLPYKSLPDEGRRLIRRQWDKRTREKDREKRLAYARWYYQNVTKPKRHAQ